MVNKNKALMGGPPAGREDGDVAAGETLQPGMLAAIASVGVDGETVEIKAHDVDGEFSPFVVKKQAWYGDVEDDSAEAINETIDAGDFVEVARVNTGNRILGRLAEDSTTTAGETRLVSDGTGGVRPVDGAGGEVVDSPYYLAREAITTAVGETSLIILEVL